ncbi:amino acid ABC transporter substrate-binding protein [Uliginosibacterium sp. H1]|uniref:amino acid ABC transporter substrate-binding protein n=1 Tax=Uliginosibacterium sp. H1 TaxID=3114757 RepID=UPI002E1794EF|nr:amino acid ABC transporter substrate-binding protein [Uliginosibacterium sp. H1]
MFRRALLCLLLAPLLASTAHADVLARVKKSKSIAIAYRTDAVPFSFLDEGKQPTGYSIDLCRSVVGQISEQLRIDRIDIKWVPVTVQNRFDVIAKGQADIECGASSVTLSRMKQVSFSSFTFADGIEVLVKSSSGAKRLTDLGGKKIGVLGGTTNESILRASLRGGAINADTVVVASREEGFARFEKGELDAFVGDQLLLLGLLAKSQDPRAIAMLDEPLAIEPYALVLPRNDDDFRLSVNTALAHIYRDGTISGIFGRWFGKLGQPSPIVRMSYTFGALPE